MGQFRDRILCCIGDYLGKDLTGMDMNRRVYDVFLESLQDSPDEENLPAPQDGLRPTDYLTLGVAMALEEALDLHLDGEWWAGVLHFGSFRDLESRLCQEIEDRVRLSACTPVS